VLEIVDARYDHEVYTNDNFDVALVIYLKLNDVGLQHVEIK